jgi:hypothetical protein
MYYITIIFADIGISLAIGSIKSMESNDIVIMSFGICCAMNVILYYLYRILNK